MAIDPVCKMEVDEKSAAATSEYQGKTYYFCAPGCKRPSTRTRRSTPGSTGALRCEAARVG